MSASKEYLEGLSRKELQQVAKKHNVKANDPSGVILENILASQEDSNSQDSLPMERVSPSKDKPPAVAAAIEPRTEDSVPAASTVHEATEPITYENIFKEIAVRKFKRTDPSDGSSSSSSSSSDATAAEAPSPMRKRRTVSSVLFDIQATYAPATSLFSSDTARATEAGASTVGSSSSRGANRSCAGAEVRLDMGTHSSGSGNRKRSIAELRALAETREAQKSAADQAVQHRVQSAQASTRVHNAVLLFDILRNISRTARNRTVFGVSEVVGTVMREYPHFADGLPVEVGGSANGSGSGGGAKAEVKRILVRLAEMAPEFVSIEQQSSGSGSGSVESLSSQGNSVRKAVGGSGDGSSGAVPAAAVSVKNFIRLNLHCAYADVRAKLKQLAAAEAVSASVVGHKCGQSSS